MIESLPKISKKFNEINTPKTSSNSPTLKNKQAIEDFEATVQS